MKPILKDHPSESSSKSAQIMTYNSLVVGVALFIVLSVAAYIFFPILVKNELSSLEEAIMRHERIPAHQSAGEEINELRTRVAVMEAQMQRIDPEFVAAQADSIR